MILAWSDLIHHFHGHAQDLIITNNRPSYKHYFKCPLSKTIIIFLPLSLYINYSQTLPRWLLHRQ